MPEDNTLYSLNKKLDDHIEEYNAKCAEHLAWMRGMREAQDANTKNIASLTEATKTMVDISVTAKALQRLTKWLTGFAGVGVIAAWWSDLIKVG